MKTNVKPSFVLAGLIVAFSGVNTSGIHAQEPLAPIAENSGAGEEADVTGKVCPRYVWMNHGSYYSYYAQKYPLCPATNYDSTSYPLNYSGDCMTGVGCLDAAMLRKLADTYVPRADDPGDRGYGFGKPGDAGARRGRLNRAAGQRPWPGQSFKITATHVDDFEIDFTLADGQARQAQVMVIKARVTETGEVTGLFGRGNEIHRFPHPRAPEEGTVGAVTPISGRPHAFEFEYTPSNGEPPFMIEIITHHSTPGHGN